MSMKWNESPSLYRYCICSRRARRARRVFRPQLLIGKRAGPDVPELDPDEPAQVAGRHMLQIEDAEQIVPDLDEHALLHSCRL